MPDLDAIKRKYDLVNNDNYRQLREEYLNFIVKQAASPLAEGILRGMLILVNESDKWEENFLSARKKMDNKAKE